MSILLEVLKYIIKIKGVMRVFSYLWVCFFNIWKVYKQKFEFFFLKSMVFMRIDTFKNYFLVWKGVIRMFRGWVKICGVCGCAFFNILKSQVKLHQVTLFNNTTFLCQLIIIWKKMQIKIVEWMWKMWKLVLNLVKNLSLCQSYPSTESLEENSKRINGKVDFNVVRDPNILLAHS